MRWFYLSAGPMNFGTNNPVLLSSLEKGIDRGWIEIFRILRLYLTIVFVSLIIVAPLLAMENRALASTAFCVGIVYTYGILNNRRIACSRGTRVTTMAWLAVCLAPFALMIALGEIDVLSAALLTGWTLFVTVPIIAWRWMPKGRSLQ